MDTNLKRVKDPIKLCSNIDGEIVQRNGLKLRDIATVTKNSQKPRFSVFQVFLHIHFDHLI